ncbi:MAG: response regulator [Spirochaetes bacterium]|nr:MAG: response regulator [Spirochaetota bacterium]
MAESGIKSFIYSKHKDETYIIQQKAFVLFWVNIIISTLLVLVNIINLTTSASTHPVVISSVNIFLLASLLFAVWLLVKGRYNFAVACTLAAVSVRVVAGCLIKLDSLAEFGSNNNIYFMFAAIAFSSFFGTRTLMTLVSGFIILMNISFIFLVERFFVTDKMSYITGSTINITISLIIVYALSYFISLITDNALQKTQEELEKNKTLGSSLENKVIELQSMYEEMEAMNEELTDTSNALMLSNKEIKIFKELADASTQGFVIADDNGTVTYFNEAMKRLIHGEKDVDMAGTGIIDLYPEEYRDMFLNRIMSHVKAHDYWTGELPLLLNGNAELPALLSIFAIGDSEKTTVLYALIATDLRERKRLEAQLIHSQKMEAVGRLAGGIAHDFNNYLTAISGYSELLLRQLGPGSPFSENVLEIIKAARSSSALTKQILSFSKKQMVRPIAVNINHEVEDMKKLLTHTIGEDIELITIPDERLHLMKIDPVQIEQVLMNLAINARDSMPHGGRLVIRTENRLFPEKAVSADPIRSSEFVCISIEDTGVGISADHLGLIFEPFFTTKESSHGTGLGLSVIAGIVEQNGGWITVQSEVGKGTVFCLCFPAFHESAAFVEKKKTSIDQLRGKGERILVVEDQDEVRKFAVTALSKHGYSVMEASRYADAVKILERVDYRVECVFTDMTLPDRSGIDLIEEIMKSGGAMCFLVSSGYTDKHSNWNKIVEKNIPFLPKPYNLNDLLQSVYDALHAKRA